MLKISNGSSSKPEENVEVTDIYSELDEHMLVLEISEELIASFITQIDIQLVSVAGFTFIFPEHTDASQRDLGTISEESIGGGFIQEAELEMLDGVGRNVDVIRLLGCNHEVRVVKTVHGVAVTLMAIDASALKPPTGFLEREVLVQQQLPQGVLKTSPFGTGREEKLCQTDDDGEEGE